MERRMHTTAPATKPRRNTSSVLNMASRGTACWEKGVMKKGGKTEDGCKEEAGGTKGRA
jgi:hypothetical protein